MRKKVLLGILLLSMLLFTTACDGNNKKTKDDKQVAVESAMPTVKPTNSPLPTADVSVKKNSGGKSILNNNTAGYNVSYNSKKLKFTNTGSSISFVPSNKKDNTELNIFFNITEVTKDSANELGKQLKYTYKGNVKVNEKIIGSGKTAADCYTITDSKEVTHNVYIILSDKKSWYIELKCPLKYKKKYMTLFDEILGSMEF